MRTLFLAALLSTGLLACGNFPDVGASGHGTHACGDDLDCAGDRLCVDGLCVFPAAPADEDCVEQVASCGCPGFGLAEGLVDLAVVSCAGGESLRLQSRAGGAGAWLSWDDGDEVCTGALQPCEVAGIGRLLDQAGTGCETGEATEPCAVPGAASWVMACRSTGDGDTRCLFHPFGLGRCGEGEVAEALEAIRARVRADPETVCPE